MIYIGLQDYLKEKEALFLDPPSRPNSPQISVQMVDEDVISRISILFGVKYSRSESRNSKWKPTFRVTLRGKKAVALMKELQPLMGIRRRDQISRAISSHNPNFREDNLTLNRKQWKEVVSRLDIGETRSSIAKFYNVTYDVIRNIDRSRECSSIG